MRSDAIRGAVGVQESAEAALQLLVDPPARTPARTPARLPMGWISLPFARPLLYPVPTLAPLPPLHPSKRMRGHACPPARNERA